MLYHLDGRPQDAEVLLRRTLVYRLAGSHGSAMELGLALLTLTDSLVRACGGARPLVPSSLLRPPPGSRDALP